MAFVRLDDLPRERTQLLSNLGRLRPVTPEVCDALADHMGLRHGDVDEVAAFYSYLSLPGDAVRVCTGPVCDCAGARDLLAREQELGTAVEAPCLGHCDLAPAALAGDTQAPASHRANDGASTGLARQDDTLADYVARGGYAPLPERTRALEELAASGLRGLGGAGFPTARKWEAVLAAGGDPVVVCNADEGEPGTFKDRYLLELRPHLVLDGLLIAMRTLGARDGIVYLREEYVHARRRLEHALAELGGLPETIEIVVGAGSYICGEETALLESLEGRRPMPRLRPPFPAQRGYLGRPTLVQNVETLAHLPKIVRDGGDAFAALGTPRLFSISGCVARPGCYEAPAATPVRELIDDFAGGATEPVGAVVPGGAASGILPPDALDRPAGGSGAIQVFPERYPVLRLLEETLRFFAEESCQKCTPCRLGTRGTLHLVRELRAGRAAMPPDRLERWLDAMERGSICGLGQAAPTPLRDALRAWPHLFTALAEAPA